MLRVVFFGDSICVGQGVSIHKGWVTRIASQISNIYGDRGDVVIVNTSINGNTTRQALERMPYDVQSHGVDVLIVQFGMNDCNYWLSDRGMPRVSPRGFAANLEEIIARGITFGARKVLVNTNHPTLLDTDVFPETDTTYEASNRLYNSIIRDVVQEKRDRVTLNDVEMHIRDTIQSGNSTLADLLLEDRLHLSVKGHDLYFGMTATIVERLVEECLADL